MDTNNINKVYLWQINYMQQYKKIHELQPTRQSPRSKWLKAFMMSPTNAPKRNQNKIQ